MAENISEEAFLNTPNPQLYLAIHEAADERMDASLDHISEERHLGAIGAALERLRRRESGSHAARIDEWARGYDRGQIRVENNLVGEYILALRDQDVRNERQLARDALIDREFEEDGVEAYDVLLQGLSLPDQEFVPPDQKPGYEDINFPEHRLKAPKVTADFVGVNQDKYEVRAVSVLEGEQDVEKLEDIFESAKTYVNSNEEYRDFSFDSEFIPAASLRDSNPVPPVYTGDVHYTGSAELESETQQIIDDLAYRDFEELHAGERQRVGV